MHAGYFALQTLPSSPHVEILSFFQGSSLKPFAPVKTFQVISSFPECQQHLCLSGHIVVFVLLPLLECKLLGDMYIRAILCSLTQYAMDRVSTCGTIRNTCLWSLPPGTDIEFLNLW